MTIIGAISTQHQSSAIYFCKYSKEEIDKKKLNELLAMEGYTSVNDDDIEIVCIESEDGMKSDNRIVGLMFRISPTLVKSVLLEEYAELECFLETMRV